MRIENKKALASARFPGPFATRISHPIVTVCQQCPGGETIADPESPAYTEEMDTEARSNLDKVHFKACNDVEAKRAKLEGERTFKTRTAWREHCTTAHK